MLSTLRALWKRLRRSKRAGYLGPSWQKNLAGKNITPASVTTPTATVTTLLTAAALAVTGLLAGTTGYFASQLTVGSGVAVSTITVSGASFKYGVSANSATIGVTDLVTDPTNHRVGVGTAQPQSTLDVRGSFSFGSGATISTGAAAGGLALAGGLTFNGGTNAAPAVSFSSADLQGAELRQTASTACFAGSTLTWTATGGPVEISLDAMDYEDTGGTYSGYYGFLLDGQYVAPVTDAVHAFIQQFATASLNFFHISFRRTIRPAAGVHTLCLTADSDSWKRLKFHVGETAEWKVTQY